MEAVFHVLGWVAAVVVTAIAAPPIILVYTWKRGDRPVWRVFWRRYGSVLLHVIGG